MAPTSGDWTIALATFSRGDHRGQAEAIRQEFIAATGLTGAWVDSNSERSILRYGRYSSLEDPRAMSDLERIKSTSINGRNPFRMAFLTPITGGPDPGTMPQYNLINARRQFPLASDLYTLQIAVFEAQPGLQDEAREAAEAYVTQLRARGEPAFYYHGPRYSSVTVGVFPADAVDPRTGVYSPEVQAFQQRYPHNVVNGRLLMITRRYPSKTIEEPQPSMLVRIPEP